MGLGTRRRDQLPRWAQDPLWTLARAVPSLDLRFAANRSLRDAVTGRELVTFTRASNATVVGPTGVIETVANDVPRFQHDPVTGQCLGFLPEEQRVNSIRNNTMVGAVAGTPGTLPTNWTLSGLGTLTQQIVAIGTLNGINYIDLRVSGTTSTTQLTIRLDTPSGITAVNAQTWAVSAWTSLVAGSLSNISASGINANIWNSGGGYIGGALLVPINTTATFTRVSGTDTIAVVGTAFIQPQIYLVFSSGVAIDITLRIGLPQLEQGAFATSVIPTTGTSATRSADIATISTLGSSIRSLFAQVRGPASGTRGIIGLDDNSANNRIELLTSGTDPKLLVTTGGSAVADLDGGTVAANVEARLAARFAADNYAISVGGGAEVVDATGALPAVDRIRIGALQAGNTFSGTIARLTAWDQVLPNLRGVSQ
jgi:hypothetical protein